MDDSGFREYVAARLEPLRRTAYLMCGDWHTADDIVSTAVLKIYRDWRRISRMENVDAYVRRAVINAWFDERRRPWRRERSVPELPPSARPVPEQGGASRSFRGDQGSVNDRLAILGHLGALPNRQRAVIVLRFYCDLSVEETAQVMDCSPGTVKSQTARALDSLRAAMVDISDLV